MLEPWQPEDLTNAVVGVAAVQHKSAAAAAMLDAAAHEVCRQLSNRHSSAAAFTVDGVIDVLNAHANLEYKDGEYPFQND